MSWKDSIACNKESEFSKEELGMIIPDSTLNTNCIKTLILMRMKSILQVFSVIH